MKKLLLALILALPVMGADIKFGWMPNPPVEEIEEYVLYYGTEAGNPTASVSVDPSSLEQIDVDKDGVPDTVITKVIPLEPGTTYYVSVAARNYVGNTDRSPEIVVNLVAPTVPKGLQLIKQ